MGDAPAGLAKALHLAVLDDVDAEAIGGAGKAPRDRVMAGGACARLQEAAIDREARILGEIQMRHHALHLLAGQKLRVDAVQPHGVAAPGEGVHLPVGMSEIEDAALGEHHVEVEVLGEPLPQLHRMLVELGVRGQQVVRAHDGGVAPGIAAADPALLQHGDIFHTVQLGQIVGRGEPVPTAANDHHVIMRLRLGIAPGALPAAVAAKRLAHEAKGRVFAGHPLQIAHSLAERMT